mgnify:CR=1 FL=1
MNKKGGGLSSQIRSGTPLNYAETLDFFESFGFFISGELSWMLRALAGILIREFGETRGVINVSSFSLIQEFIEENSAFSGWRRAGLSGGRRIDRSKGPRTDYRGCRRWTGGMTNRVFYYDVPSQVVISTDWLTKGQKKEYWISAISPMLLLTIWVYIILNFSVLHIIILVKYMINETRQKWWWQSWSGKIRRIFGCPTDAIVSFLLER